MIVPVMAISNLVLPRQIYCEETNGAHEHNRDRVPLAWRRLWVNSGPAVCVHLIESQIKGVSVSVLQRCPSYRGVR